MTTATDIELPLLGAAPAAVAELLPEPSPAREISIVAMVHIGLRDRAYVLNSDGEDFTLPDGSTRLGGQYITAVLDLNSHTATAQP